MNAGDCHDPPSTLAAQLVDGITNRPSRSSFHVHGTGSDEDDELKRLIAGAMKIKEDPNAIKTEEKHLEHNHLLLYAYVRLRLKEIFVDSTSTTTSSTQAQIKQDLNDVTKFIEITLKETKRLLDHKDTSGEFLLRGNEPFWMWLMPKIMCFLGHEKCMENTDELEDSLACMVYTAMQIKETNPDVYRILEYLKDAVNEISAVLLNPNTKADQPFQIDLPPTATLERICSSGGGDDQADWERLQYRVCDPGRLIGQATSFLRILTNHALLEAQEDVILEYGLWILDALQCLGTATLNFHAHFKSDITPILKIALDILDSDRFKTNSSRIIFQEKAPVVLVLLCSEIASLPQVLMEENDNGQACQHTFARALIKLVGHCIVRPEIARIVTSNILPKLDPAVSMYAPGPDFPRILTLLTEASENVSPAFSFGFSSRPELFVDSSLRKCVEKLHLDWVSSDETGQPDAKRRKTKEEEDSKIPILHGIIFKRLHIDLDGESMVTVIVNAFPHMSLGDKCLIIELISHFACAADKTLEMDIDHVAHTTTIHCGYCQTPEVAPMKDTEQSLLAKSMLFQTLTQLIALPEFESSRKPRVVAMLALQKLALHFHSADLYDLEQSKLGLWCLKSLRSSIRELRIAASRTFPLFLRHTAFSGVDANVITRNRIHVIGFLKQISHKEASHLHETVLPEYELNPVLIQMVEMLGSTSHVVSTIAAVEIRALAKSRSRTTLKMFEPFWKYLSYVVVKNFAGERRRCTKVAELLGLDLIDLLVLVQRHALPWLVLESDIETIRAIAAAMSKEVTPLLMSKGNLPPILALLMVNSVENTEAAAMSQLCRVGDEFKNSDLMALIRSELVPTIHELFKHAATRDDDKRRAVLCALKWCSVRLMSSRDPKRKSPDVIGYALEPHMLGLVSSLTEVINIAVTSQQVTVEQTQCIAAMEEMIKICKSHVRTGRAQISASLLSVMTMEELRRPALSAWAAMVLNLDEADAVLLLEPTYYVVIQYWIMFDAASKTMAEKLILDLYAKYPEMFNDNIFKIPSLRHTPALAKLEDELGVIKKAALEATSVKKMFSVYVERITHENSGVVWLGLGDLITFLKTHQSWIQASALSESPDDVVSMLLRSLLDCAARFNGLDYDICCMCTECLGLIGCLDSNRVEANKEQRSIVVYNNFTKEHDKAEFGFFLLTEVLLKSFSSTTDTRMQGFLAYAMQELLERCDIKALVTGPGTRGGNDIAREWALLPSGDKELLNTFMFSRYVLNSNIPPTAQMPSFRPDGEYSQWLKEMVFFLIQNPQNPNAALIFEPLMRLVRVKDTSVAEHLLPYVFCHVVIGCESSIYKKLNEELLAILEFDPTNIHSPEEKRHRNRYYESVFSILDYMMRWVHKKKVAPRLDNAQTAELERVQKFLDNIPPQLIAQRAITCNQYNRALFHLELHIRETSTKKGHIDGENKEELMAQLQEVYAQIDEPDGLEGISAHFQVLDLEQQVLSNKKAQRWTAAQTWCEYRLSEEPENTDIQMELLTCLKNSGQYDVLLSYAESLRQHPALENKISSFAVEAAWATGRWEDLNKLVRSYNGNILDDFNLSIGEIFRCLYNKEYESIPDTITMIREKISAALTTTTTSSLQACRDLLLQCHVLSDLEMILANKPKTPQETPPNNDAIMANLSRRVGVLGSFASDKHYVLGVQRAAMNLMCDSYTNLNISSLWLASGKMSRKAGLLQQSFNSVLHASHLGDGSAIIENAKLLYKEGHGRRAIQILESAIAGNKLSAQSQQAQPSVKTSGTGSVTSSKGADYAQKLLIARAQLMIAKWLDATGQTNVLALREKFQEAAKTCQAWEKGHYWLGRHYKKLLEYESKLTPDEQTDATLMGTVARVVIENYLRSLNFGTKYLHQTLPRIITVWLEFAALFDESPTARAAMAHELKRRRLAELNAIHACIEKFTRRLPAYVFYTALPQMVARITHKNADAVKLLVNIIAKVVASYPQQALWGIFPLLMTPRNAERSSRGKEILSVIRAADPKLDGRPVAEIIRKGEKLAAQLVWLSQTGDFQSNRSTMTTLNQLKFNANACLPSPLVVPAESCLMAKLPTLPESSKRKHQPFSGDVVTIHSFEQEVLVLGSMARPRRVIAIGSNGQKYKLLIKPKDDLRADQRLIEFNNVINKALKKDPESSKRQLYVRSYAVTPLAEEGGIIEWVDGLKTLRDILLMLYKQRGLSAINYQQLENLCKAAANDATLFTRDVLGKFPPVLHVWFIDNFPDPTSWFTARLRYTRSCAVMSMVGTILGLGDRHGENILLEEGNGGVFHVDFNCLFDKGLTFSTPERVPFRLTHNMVAAMGIYGYEGPFRQCSELTLATLRAQKETLLTIIEAFIYDPTIDLLKDKGRRARPDGRVRMNPQSAHEGVKRRLLGFLPNELIPLGVEGQVDELIKQAVNPKNLAAMYIGWCSFL
ncbi:Protein kinase rad3 [Ceratocystis fimbriata CBS 114723]|uniref:non-specific serine/threonine protein kinase n=1 Tax=Ceratocystis fimbriata CBS 114723 TaxID=1035309 RepID=A0A2C5X0B3_9PEZI|nr:Protein kinase rad3 [Ceratocystis fimbriata CBS 114723]